jgi:hypothetical protein
MQQFTIAQMSTHIPDAQNAATLRDRAAHIALTSTCIIPRTVHEACTTISIFINISIFSIVITARFCAVSQQTQKRFSALSHNDGNPFPTQNPCLFLAKLHTINIGNTLPKLHTINIGNTRPKLHTVNTGNTRPKLHTINIGNTRPKLHTINIGNTRPKLHTIKTGNDLSDSQDQNRALSDASLAFTAATTLLTRLIFSLFTLFQTFRQNNSLAKQESSQIPTLSKFKAFQFRTVLRPNPHCLSTVKSQQSHTIKTGNDFANMNKVQPLSSPRLFSPVRTKGNNPLLTYPANWQQSRYN